MNPHAGVANAADTNPNMHAQRIVLDCAVRTGMNQAKPRGIDGPQNLTGTNVPGSRGQPLTTCCL